MTNLTRNVIAGLLLAMACAAQSNSVVNQSNAQQPSILTVTQVGVPGTTQYCYWVTANYAGGKSVPAGPICTYTANSTLSSSNYDVVAFSAPSSPLVSVSNYDVLRTTTTTPPTGTCNCAVATAQGSSPVNDQSNSLSGYTVASLATVTTDIVGDNETTASTVSTRIRVNGTTQLLLNGGGVAQISPSSFTQFTTPFSPVAVNGTTDANNTAYVSQIFIPTTVTLTGACWYNGGTVTTDKHLVELWNTTGILLANSATGGVADAGNASKFQCANFTATVVVAGPGLYYIGAVSNGTTDTINTYAAGCCGTNFFAGTVSQTFGTVGNITVPSSFNANQGALMIVY